MDKATLEATPVAVNPESLSRKKKTQRKAASAHIRVESDGTLHIRRGFEFLSESLANFAAGPASEAQARFIQDRALTGLSILESSCRKLSILPRRAEVQ